MADKQQVRLSYYSSEGQWISDAVLDTELYSLSKIHRHLQFLREERRLPGITNTVPVIIWFQTVKRKTGVVPLPESGGVSFGDRAEGNMVITGSVRGDVMGGRNR